MGKIPKITLSSLDQGVRIVRDAKTGAEWYVGAHTRLKNGNIPTDNQLLKVLKSLEGEKPITDAQKRELFTVG